MPPESKPRRRRHITMRAAGSYTRCCDSSYAKSLFRSYWVVRTRMPVHDEWTSDLLSIVPGDVGVRDTQSGVQGSAACKLIEDISRHVAGRAELETRKSDKLIKLMFSYPGIRSAVSLGFMLKAASWASQSQVELLLFRPLANNGSSSDLGCLPFYVCF